MKGLAITGLMLLAASTAAMAQMPPQTFTFQIPAATSSAFKDNAGNTWTLTVPNAMTLTLQFAPAVATTPLASGVYNFNDVANALSMDSGWNPPTVGLYSQVNDSCQKWTWNGSQLSTPLPACGEAGFLTDNGSGFATMASPGDKLQIQLSGSGYTVKDVTTGNYFASSGVSGANGVVTQSAPYVWSTIAAMSTSAAHHVYPHHAVSPR